MTRRLAALACIAAFSLALPAVAIDLAGSPESIAAEKARWVERLTEKQRDVANAKVRYASAQRTYQRMRTRNTSRGDKRSRVVDDLAAAETALAEAERELESILAEARREGVPPGWIRDADSRSRSPASTAND